MDIAIKFVGRSVFSFSFTELAQIVISICLSLCEWLPIYSPVVTFTAQFVVVSLRPYIDYVINFTSIN